MAETPKAKKRKKKKPFLNDLDIYQVARLVFLIFLAVFLVYLYYLHTKGALLSTVQILWEKHQKSIEVVAGVIVYSSLIFYLGYRKGKKR